MSFKKSITLDEVSERLLALLLILLPFHAFLKTWFTAVYTDSTIDFLSTGSFIIAVWKELILLLLGIIWIIKIVKKRKWLFSWTEADIVFTIFMGINLIYAVLTPDKSAVLWGLKTNVSFIVLYFIVRSMTFRYLTQKVLLKYVLFTSIVVNIVAWLQLLLPPSFWLFFGFSPYVSSYVDYKPLPLYHAIGEKFDIIRVYGTLSGPNQLGAYLSFIVFLFIASLFVKKLFTKPVKIVILLTTLSSIAILLLTYSRAALIGFIVGAFIFLILKWKSKIKYAVVSSLTVLMLTGITTWYVVDFPSFDTYIIHGASSSERLERWQEGVDIVLKNPMGLGLGQAGPVSRRLYCEEEAINCGGKAIISENWYLQLAEETGIISSLLFLAGMIYLLTHLHSLSKQSTNSAAQNLSVGMIAGLSAILINGLFLHTWDDTTLAFIAAILLGFYIRQYDNEINTTTKLKSKALEALVKQKVSPH